MKNKIKEEAIKGYLDFENKMLSHPCTFFPMMERAIEMRDKIIWNEFIEWQRNGGKVRPLEFREKKGEYGTIYLFWDVKNELFGQVIERTLDKEVYKTGIEAVYSFMGDRPQYYKFRKMDGMFNPLRLLLYHFMKVKD